MIQTLLFFAHTDFIGWLEAHAAVRWSNFIGWLEARAAVRWSDFIGWLEARATILVIIIHYNE